MRLFAVLAITAITFLPAAGNQKQSQPEKQDTKAQETSTPPPVTVNVVQNSPATPQQQNCPQPQPRNWYEWFWPPIWSNWGIIIIAAFAACAAFGTLGEIKKQSASTEKAADAARGNATAVINAERAWVMVDIKGVDIQGNDIPPQATYVKDKISVVVTFHCRNDGKTPAWITEKWVNMKLVEGIPAQPDFSDRSQVVQTSVQPLSAGEQSPRPHQSDVLVYTLLCKGDELDRMAKTLLIYGYAKYRTIFATQQGETRFGYILHLSGVFERLSESNSTYNSVS